MKNSVLLFLIGACLSQPAAAQTSPEGPKFSYPTSKRVDVVEDHFGTDVADPYRWLEEDSSSNADVAAWVRSQASATEDYLSQLPQRHYFHRKLAELYQFDRVTAPQQAGERYFYTLNSGEDYAGLYMRQGSESQSRLLLDPNKWSENTPISFKEWSASPDGSHLAYAVQEGGGDWRTIRVLNVDTGEQLKEEVSWARYTQLRWAPDGSGFFYSRVPEPEEGQNPNAGVSGHAVYFHALDKKQSEDRLIFETPSSPTQLNIVSATADGRYLVILSTPDLARTEILVVDLLSSPWEVRFLAGGDNNRWAVIGNDGSRFFLYSNKDAPNGKLVSVDLEGPSVDLVDIIPEQDAILHDGYVAGDRFLISYLVDAKSQLRRFQLDGREDGDVKLPSLGTVSNFKGNPKGDHVLFEFESFDTPTTVYRYNVKTDALESWFKPSMAEQTGERVVEQRFYNSADGTRIPMFIVRKKGMSSPAPTILLAYGGYGVSMLPDYSAALMAWVDAGGVAAIANIRGGGEYGPRWHEAARGLKRQNAFDDFIAAGEFLKAEGITSPKGLAINGDSNAGLLVGAVTNQRPDLFDVALPGVGVMDMIRYPIFTGGSFWIGEFGNPSEETHFRNLYSYSPYHNIQTGRDYPAILAVTADTDARVVPAHTFKYVAALQAADIGNKPHLVRVGLGTGHGDSLSRSSVIAQLTDVWAFAAFWTGLKNLKHD